MENLIDFITYELEQIHGELMIQEVFANEVDDKIMDIVHKTPNADLRELLGEIGAYQELGREKYELISRLEYLKGMMEAYSKVIAKLKKNEE